MIFHFCASVAALLLDLPWTSDCNDELFERAVFSECFPQLSDDGVVACADREAYVEGYDSVPGHWLRFEDTVNTGVLSHPEGMHGADLVSAHGSTSLCLASFPASSTSSAYLLYTGCQSRTFLTRSSGCMQASGPPSG